MSKLSTKVLLVFLLNFLFIFIPIRISANGETVSIKNEDINPGSLNYTFKRLGEKGRELLLFNKQAKIDYKKALLKIRLSELNFVVEHNFLSEVQRSSERFAYQAGILTQELIKFDKSAGKKNAMNDFGQYNKLLANLRDKYESNSAFWMLIQHDINTLDILAERLK